MIQILRHFVYPLSCQPFMLIIAIYIFTINIRIDIYTLASFHIVRNRLLVVPETFFLATTFTSPVKVRRPGSKHKLNFIRKQETKMKFLEEL